MTSQATAAAQHDKLTIKDQLPVILSYLDDARKLIEAGKVRRWEVFKWAFALNLLFASATAAHDKLPISPAVFILASIGTSIMAALLINHYDHRMNGARARARDLTQWLRENVLDVNSVMQEFGQGTRSARSACRFARGSRRPIGETPDPARSFRHLPKKVPH